MQPLGMHRICTSHFGDGMRNLIRLCQDRPALAVKAPIASMEAALTAAAKIRIDFFIIINLHFTVTLYHDMLLV